MLKKKNRPRMLSIQIWNIWAIKISLDNMKIAFAFTYLRKLNENYNKTKVVPVLVSEKSERKSGDLSWNFWQLANYSNHVAIQNAFHDIRLRNHIDSPLLVWERSFSVERSRPCKCENEHHKAYEAKLVKKIITTITSVIK